MMIEVCDLRVQGSSPSAPTTKLPENADSSPQSAFFSFGRSDVGTRLVLELHRVRRDISGVARWTLTIDVSSTFRRLRENRGGSALVLTSAGACARREQDGRSLPG